MVCVVFYVDKNLIKDFIMFFFLFFAEPQSRSNPQMFMSTPFARPGTSSVQQNLLQQTQYPISPSNFCVVFFLKKTSI